MIFTARQLEDLHRSAGGNGQVVLPYGARLTPLAADWARSRRVAVGYSNVEIPSPLVKPVATQPAPAQAAQGAWLWWCDGPCGPAKAAVAAQARESSLSPIEIPSDARRTAEVIRHLAGEVKAARAVGGILLVQHAAAATVLANRCTSLRAVVGTGLAAVEQGIALVAANVLVIEYSSQSMSQMRNLLRRFVHAGRELEEGMSRSLKELSACG